MVLIVGALLAAFVYFSQPAKHSEQVTLLPGPDGRASGVVVVERNGIRHVLDRSYATSRAGDSQVTLLPESQVRTEFGALLRTLPARPASFLLYFLSGQDELTPESRAELEQILAELRRRPVPDVAVIAHTDTVGEAEANDALSMQRAERVKAFLVGIGIPASRIHVSGRGEREPLVRTADNVDEPRNRRVEISVR